ncbi:DNA polymerase V subunit UmuC [Shigella sonnei]|nr:DNA polymerase V subunit UmuC [Shigella sonnei]
MVDLSNLERQRKLMSALPVDDVWGIGRRISKKLDAMGIKTVLDLADTDIRFIRKHFVVTLPGRRKNFAVSINIVGLSPHLLRRHHLRSMNLITAIARR